jgi:hypothetical protein
MTVVVTLEDYRPSPRYDGEPWTDARIEEGPAYIGPWTTLETIALSPVDADPTNPAYRNFTTDLGTADELWYRIVFLDADASTGLPTIPVQNIEDDMPAFAPIGELYPILNIRTPTDSQQAKAGRMMSAAAYEIRQELDFVDGVIDLSAGGLNLCAMVNLGRAAELWKQEETQLGIMLGIDQGSVYVGTDTWKRWSVMLAPAKDQFGFA